MFTYVLKECGHFTEVTEPVISSSFFFFKSVLLLRVVCQSEWKSVLSINGSSH